MIFKLKRENEEITIESTSFPVIGFFKQFQGHSQPSKCLGYGFGNQWYNCGIYTLELACDEE